MPINMNMMQYIQMIKGGNPQEVVMNMLQESATGGNPMAENLIQMVNNRDSQGIERVARNVARERGKIGRASCRERVFSSV